MGSEGSLFRGETPEIHNGADDNASGVAVMLNLAKELKTKNIVGLRANHFSGKDVCLSVPVTFVQH